MNKKRYINILMGLWGVIICCYSCKHGEGEYHNLYDKIQAESTVNQDTTISSEAFFDNIKTIEITEGKHTFLIPERKSQIKMFDCAECHTQPLNKLKSPVNKKAHWNISLEHANSNTMNCVTCHNASKMNSLKTLTGHVVDFNSSYQLCAQCHSSQFEDWKGGAHGKRIGGWTAPRASFTCVNCHNPHSPSFKKRWPSRLNIKQIEASHKGAEH